MKVLFLAAGFSTRLKPLTDNFPKGLLEIQGKPIISRLLEQSLQLTEVDDWALVTNHICFPHYQRYIENNHYPFRVIDNEVSTIKEQKGAIGDLEYALIQLKWHDDVLVLPSDTLISIQLADFFRFFSKHQSFANVIFDSKDKSLIAGNFGCAELDGEKLIGFEEKPANPKTTLTSVPIYIYPQQILPLITTYLQAGLNADSPGSIIPWLIKHTKAYGYLLPSGYYYDVGTIDVYKEMTQNVEKYAL